MVSLRCPICFAPTDTGGKCMDDPSHTEKRMNEHDPLPISGYTPQPKLAVDLVNQHKRMEEVILRRLDNMPAMYDADPRWLALARTHIEQGFMALNRAVFKPERLKD
jgi:hypothetical protein